jgi:hypothetical protein
MTRARDKRDQVKMEIKMKAANSTLVIVNLACAAAADVTFDVEAIL